MALIWPFIIFALFFGFLFLYFKLKLPQTIWLGITFLAFLVNMGMSLVVFLIQINSIIPLTILAILFAISFLSMPFLTVGTFFINGIKVIRREGFKFSNSLSLLLAILLIIYLVYWPTVVDVTQSHILNTLYQFISFSVVYLSSILVFYTTTNLLNLIHLKKQKMDYFIVLGAGLLGEKVSPLLASRIDRGLDLQKEQNSGKIVLSGGQGADEVIPEGEAMTRYALDQGVNPDAVLKETKSKSTHENIKFSKQIIENDWNLDTPPKIAIVTNNYHVLRGLMQARSLDLNCIGYGSRSRFYFSLNAFLREFVAYLQFTYKVHSIIISLFGIILFGLYLLLEAIS